MKRTTLLLLLLCVSIASATGTRGTRASSSQPSGSGYNHQRAQYAYVPYRSKRQHSPKTKGCSMWTLRSKCK